MTCGMLGSSLGSMEQVCPHPRPRAHGEWGHIDHAGVSMEIQV